MLKKAVTPDIRKGPAGVVVPLATGAVLLVGGWIAARTIAPQATDAVTKLVTDTAGKIVGESVKAATEPFWQWTYKVQVDIGNAWNTLWQGGSTGTRLQLSHDEGKQGSTIGIAVQGLKPKPFSNMGGRRRKISI